LGLIRPIVPYIATPPFASNGAEHTSAFGRR